MSDRRDHAEPEFPDFDENADAEAIDLALVHADDEYLDLLAGVDIGAVDGAVDDASLGEFGDEQLTRLLMTWRRDVDAEPIDDLVDTKLATVTVQAARMRRKRRPRLLVPVAAAAAVLAIAFAGVGLAARDAQPGDTLWALSKVLYSERARSVEAAQTVKHDLAEARAALTDGNVEVAKTKLADANEALPTVTREDGKDELKAQHQALLAQLPGSTSGDPGAPPVPDPSTQEPDPGSGSSSGGGSSATSATNPPDTTSPSSPPASSDNPTDPPPTSDPSTEPPRSEAPNSGTSETGDTENGIAGDEEVTSIDADSAAVAS